MSGDIKQLPTSLPMPMLDMTIFTRCLQALESRVHTLETTTSALQAENKMLREKASDLSQQALISQDQFGSLYETVHEGLSKIALLQNSAYEKTQAASDFSTVNQQLRSIREETARLDAAKVDVNSAEMEARVAQTASESTSRILAKFEVDNREWTIHQLGATEERVARNTSTRLTDVEGRVEQKLLSMQGAIDDVTFKESVVRKDVDTANTATSTALRGLAGKLEMHEKQLDGSEDAIFSQLDVVRHKFELFLEHCLGISWAQVMQSVSPSNTLLRVDARRSMTELPSDVAHRRGTLRLRRSVDNLREWRRIQAVNPRILLGMGDVTRRLEASEEQYETTSQARLQQRRAEDVAMEDQRRAELEGQLLLVRELMTQSIQKGGEGSEHAAIEALHRMLETPLFVHIRSSLSSEVRQSMSLTKEEFGQEYSNQLALVNKELRGKATLSGLEDTVREFAQRTLKEHMESLEARLREVNDNYVSQSTMNELLSSKADRVLMDRKANEGDLANAVQRLHDEMTLLNQKTITELQLQLVSRLSEVSKEISRRDPRPSSHATTSHDEATPPALGVHGIAQQNQQNRCLSCTQVVANPTQALDAATTRPASTTANSQTARYAAGATGGPADDYVKLATGYQVTQSESNPEEVGDGITPRSQEVSSRPSSAKEPFRMKEWADNVDKRFGIKERKTPRPPSANVKRN